MRMQDRECLLKAQQAIKPAAEAKIYIMILVLSLLACAYFPLFPLKNCHNPVFQFENNHIYFPQKIHLYFTLPIA